MSSTPKMTKTPSETDVSGGASVNRKNKFRGSLFKYGSKSIQHFISFLFDPNSSSIWRNNTAEVFSNTSRDEDDEEALKWAALEKLPIVV
ncbi:hypothetical protein FRX31_016673 [Thalictrum thalictroides]|uniref:Uncharacterized protein n=1 Tax=Thalictrum thalictroides TaxID=46969 RepID=A0A7J6WA44_THATH|nr:hypothetical protein FRX31_016673 [Thalictrum thalictroides]